jgi:hypothetical protein
MEEWLLYCVCIVGTVSRPQLQTSIKTRNFVTFYKFLMHLGRAPHLIHEFINTKQKFNELIQ